MKLLLARDLAVLLALHHLCPNLTIVLSQLSLPAPRPLLLSARQRFEKGLKMASIPQGVA